MKRDFMRGDFKSLNRWLSLGLKQDEVNRRFPSILCKKLRINNSSSNFTLHEIVCGLIEEHRRPQPASVCECVLAAFKCFLLYHLSRLSACLKAFSWNTFKFCLFCSHKNVQLSRELCRYICTCVLQFASVNRPDSRRTSSQRNKRTSSSSLHNLKRTVLRTENAFTIGSGILRAFSNPFRNQNFPNFHLRFLSFLCVFVEKI